MRRVNSKSKNKPGIKSQTSITDVARIAGVSIATVSRCLNDPKRVKDGTRARVQDAILQTGYSPNTLAQSFRRGKTHVIIVVLPSVGDPFFTDVMLGIRTVATARGYSLLINETQFNTLTADEIGAMVVSRQADGIVLLASMSPFGAEVLSARSHRALPTVIGCETISRELAAYPSVHIDNIAAAQTMTDHLISLGHRSIAFISGQHHSLLTRDRERGYRLAMKEAGLAVEEGWVVEGQLTIPGAIGATRRLLDHPRRPSAIFCANDEMAIGCMHAVKAAGLEVPQDLSIAGFDDIRYAAIIDPPLTTVRQPAREIGERVIYLLLCEIEGGHGRKAKAEIVPHELVIRQSVAPPRSGHH
ncbi:MAG: LacI family transcriptional regulator [Lysobacterales bacterium]|nr:MAG: LacI family transcriptional regulator [Xanthomonadales bacterium]